MKVSIIIPIYNEGENISKIIANLRELNDIYEVIFVDASNDTLAQKYIPEDFTYLRSKKGRAVQMNTGAKFASGDILLFIHCDSILHRDTLLKIISSKASFGCLSLYFDDNHPLMKICGFMSRMRARRRKIAFGDQGMFFKREVFKQLGGFKEIPLMEDYDISIRAKEVVELVQLDCPIITSSRRFYKGKGILFTMYKMQVLQFQFRRGKSIEEIAKKYD